MKKVLVIGLDGYELSLADTMIKLGQLPSLARIREKSARFLLDHGHARDTGLAWEHVSSGLSPEDAERWSAVSSIKKTMRFGRKVRYLLHFLQNFELTRLSSIFRISIFRRLATCAAWSPGAHTMPVPSSRRIPRGCLTNSTRSVWRLSSGSVDLWLCLAIAATLSDHGE